MRNEPWQDSINLLWILGNKVKSLADADVFKGSDIIGDAKLVFAFVLGGAGGGAGACFFFIRGLDWADTL